MPGCPLATWWAKPIDPGRCSEDIAACRSGPTLTGRGRLTFCSTVRLGDLDPGTIRASKLGWARVVVPWWPPHQTHNLQLRSPTHQAYGVRLSRLVILSSSRGPSSEEVCLIPPTLSLPSKPPMMTSIGPQLPTFLLEKRKRQDDGDSQDDTGHSSNGRSSPPPRKRSRSPIPELKKKQRVIGPALPPVSQDNHVTAENGNGSSDTESAPDTKTRRTVGPTLPPAPGEPPSTRSPPRAERDADGHGDEDEDDDDFGPSLPPSNGPVPSSAASSRSQPITVSLPPTQPTTRDAWMLEPPSNSDWTSRVDPTKLRNRRFNTSKSAKGPSSSSTSSDSSLWHETPQEKAARLHREMMGITTANDSSRSSVPSLPHQPSTSRHQHPPVSRGPSLYSTHQKSQSHSGRKGRDGDGGEEEDDDPSTRAFDREKDMSLSSKINTTQRREILLKSKEGIGSRFAPAGNNKYL